jgi:hypothetical protein
MTEVTEKKTQPDYVYLDDSYIFKYPAGKTFSENGGPQSNIVTAKRFSV